MGLDDPANDRKAEPRASRVGRAGALAAVEPLEDVGQVRFRDADARVDDGDPRLPGLGVDADDDAAAGLRVPQAVLHEVVEDLLEPAGVGEDVDRKPRHLGRKLQVAIAGRGLEVFHGLGDEPPEIQVREGERHAAALAACQEEEVLRDPREVPHFEDRVADGLAVLLRRPFLFERHLERAAEHGQGRAQLVGDVGDELMLLLLRRGQGVEAGVQKVHEAAGFLREAIVRDAAQGMGSRAFEPAGEERRAPRAPRAPTPLGPKSRERTPRIDPSAQAAGPAPGSRTR